MKRLIIAFFAESWQVCKDVYAAAIYVWNGPALTPEQVKAWNERHAETPPEWWHKPVVKPVEVPNSHTAIEQASKGNIVGWAGDWVVDVPAKKTVTTEGISEVLTPADVAQMKVYRINPNQVGLNNFTLAAKIKPYWQEGKKPGEIAPLAGCSESTAKHYCLCLKRANETE